MKKLLTIIAAVLAINCQAQQKPTLDEIANRLNKAGEYSEKSANQGIVAISLGVFTAPASYVSFRYLNNTTGYVVSSIGGVVTFSFSLSSLINLRRSGLSLQGYPVYDGTNSRPLPSSYTP